MLTLVGQAGLLTRTWVLIALGAAVVVAVAGWVWQTRFRIYHLATVHEGVLYRDGNRGMTEFRTAVRKVKPRTVVCLVDDSELAAPTKGQFKEELAYLGEQGVKVERIIIRLGGWPTTGDVQRFLSIVEDKARQPVLFHCAQGVRRTGMLAAAYQQSVLKYDAERAKAQMLAFGHSERTVKDVRRFIDVYDPVKREVTQQLEMSEE